MMRSRNDHDLVIDNFAVGESVVYGINWSAWLGNAQIVEAEVAAPDGSDLIVTGTQNTSAVQRFRLSGGTAGARYTLIATVTTSGGDTLKCSVLVVVRDP